MTPSILSTCFQTAEHATTYHMSTRAWATIVPPAQVSRIDLHTSIPVYSNFRTTCRAERLSYSWMSVSPHRLTRPNFGSARRPRGLGGRCFARRRGRLVEGFARGGLRGGCCSWLRWRWLRPARLRLGGL